MNGGGHSDPSKAGDLRNLKGLEMRKPIRLSELSQHERVAELLRELGHDMIDIEQFWQEMRKYGLTDEDIDRFCCGEQVR